MSILSDLFYTSAVDIRRETVTQDANGVVTGSSWALVASGVACYKEANPNATHPGQEGRLLGSNWLSMDAFHFGETQDIQADDAIKNVTLLEDGSQAQDYGGWWRVRGAPQVYTSLGLLDLGRKRVIAFPLAPGEIPES